MGRGIRTEDGADPTRAWKIRIQNFGNAALSEALVKLLAGRQVTSEDGVLEISAHRSQDGDGDGGGDGDSLDMTVRVPSARDVAQFSVRGTAPGASGPKPDRRSPFPEPERWQEAVSDTEVTWELFNCVVTGLKSDKNAPTVEPTQVVTPEPEGNEVP